MGKVEEPDPKSSGLELPQQLNAVIRACSNTLKQHKLKIDSAAKGSLLAADDIVDCEALLDLIQAAQSLYAERCPIP